MRVGHLTLFCYDQPDFIEVADAGEAELKIIVETGSIRRGNLKNMFFVTEK